ncbi:hypothetical protein BRO06_14865, partial [Xanthomonas oryzae pv. oryzae]
MHPHGREIIVLLRPTRDGTVRVLPHELIFALHEPALESRSCPQTCRGEVDEVVAVLPACRHVGPV